MVAHAAPPTASVASKFLSSLERVGMCPSWLSGKTQVFPDKGWVCPPLPQSGLCQGPELRLWAASWSSGIGGNQCNAPGWYVPAGPGVTPICPGLHWRCGRACPMLDY